MTFRNLAFPVILVCGATAAQAQVQLPNKWDSERRDVIIDVHIPVGCDQPTFNARDHLRAVEPAMQVYFSYEPNPDPAPDATTVIGRRSYGYAWQTTAGATPKAFTGAGMFESYGQLIDADIFMNHDLFYWPSTTDAERSYDFWCDQTSQGSFGTSQIDYQGAILHELVHVVGFGHRTDTTSGSCATHEQQGRGVFNRVLCSDEQAAYRSAY